MKETKQDVGANIIVHNRFCHCVEPLKQTDSALLAEGHLMIPFLHISGKQCMCLVDLDRARASEEHGFSVQVISMEPESCSPKNNMIVGVPI